MSDLLDIADGMNGSINRSNSFIDDIRNRSNIFVEMYSNGESLDDIAKVFETSSNYVRSYALRILKKEGIITSQQEKERIINRGSLRNAIIEKHKREELEVAACDILQEGVQNVAIDIAIGDDKCLLSKWQCRNINEVRDLKRVIREIAGLQEDYSDEKLAAVITYTSDSGKWLELFGGFPLSTAQKKDLDYIVNSLKERERMVIEYIYYKHLSTTEICDIMNISKERVRQIEAKAMRKLRNPTRADAIKRYNKV